MLTGDIMTKEVFAVEEDRSLSEIAALLTENRIHGVPVVDNDKKIIGIVTETDFFSKDASNIYLPSFIEIIKNRDDEKIVEKNPDMEFVMNATARDIMSRDCFFVNPYLKVEDLIRIFRETGYKTIPVANEKDELVGIVTISDIIKLI